jgi:hypothetical protein
MLKIKVIIATTFLGLIIPFWILHATVVAQKNTKVEEIIIVFKTHFDIGYTHLASDAINSYRTTMIDAALNSIEKMPADQQFVWTLPGWPLTQILWEGQNPARRLRVEEAIHKGRIAWHALPYTVETDGLDMESLARGFVFSDNLSRKYGKPLSVTGKMTDVPQHSWFLATLLSHAGVRFLHIGTNNQCIPPDVPELFFWEGPDSSRVLVNIGKQRYGSGLLPPKDWPFKTWFAMQMTGDNEGPPSSAEVTRMLKMVNDSLPGVRVKLGTIDDFYRSLSREDLSKVPVIRGDMPDTWIHGLGSMPMETKLAHNIRPQLVAWEMLETLLVQHQLKLDSDKVNIAEAYENSLMYGEHTWGSQTEGIPDSYWGDTLKKAIAEYKKHGKPAKLVKPSLPFFEESFDQHRRYIWKTRDLVESGISADMTMLAENIAVSGPRVVVFNSLPWQRDAVVTVNGKPFLAKGLPPSGYKTFPLPSKPASFPGSAVQSTEIRLESPYFKLVIDPAKGGITSLIDKKSNRELVEKDAVLGQYLFEQFAASEVFNYIGEYDQNPQWGNARSRGVYRGAPVTAQGMMNSGQQMGKPHMPLDVRYSANYAGNGTVKVERDGVGKTAVITLPPSGKNPDTVTMRIRLYDKLPYIDFEWEIKAKTPDRIPEGGWLCFPFNLKNPEWKLGRTGAITDPAKEIIGDNNVHLFALQTGVSARDSDGSGIGLCPLDAPLVSLGDPGLWKFSRSWMPRPARIYVNLFNNMWNTNFPLWIEGSWSSRVRLWTLDPKSSDWELVGKSWEARTSCPVVVANGPAGHLSAEYGGLSLSRKGVLVTAFGPNPNGTGTLLRVWEQAGTTGSMMVAFPAGSKFAVATPVNLRGEALGEPIKITESKFSFVMKAYAPASFLLN